MRGKLTDKQIDRYAKQGWYDAAFREARREMMQRKQVKRQRRDGNFLIVDGRSIYSPL